MGRNESESALSLLECGTPEWIRTTDLLLRRQTLYPAELRAHNTSISIVVMFPLYGQSPGISGALGAYYPFWGAATGHHAVGLFVSWLSEAAAFPRFSRSVRQRLQKRLQLRQPRMPGPDRPRDLPGAQNLLGLVWLLAK